MNSLMVVESPAKARTINKYLGKNFTVLASLGHVMDLASKSGSVIPEKNFEMVYEVNPDSKKYLDAIYKAAKNSESIYLATDPDREGEAIAWNIADLIASNVKSAANVPIKRVTFNAITKNSVLQAVKEPREIDTNLVKAQQARRALDYLVGFTLSPLLWRKLPGCKSAGRVQSVALRLICEREQEIQAFVKKEYWDIWITFSQDIKDLNKITDSDEKSEVAKKKVSHKKNHFLAKLVSIDGEKLNKFDIVDAQHASKIRTELQQSEFWVSNINHKQQNRNPSAPFITSTLQQEASRKLGFGAKKTMTIAQKLYEGLDLGGKESGLITYMRTDGVYISEDAIKEIRSCISKEMGDKYLPSTARKYASKVKNAQEAHEAIRPVDFNLNPEQVKPFLTTEQYKLYDLIWRRTIASQMSSAIFDVTTVDIGGNRPRLNKTDINIGPAHWGFRAAGSTMRFDGFYKVYIETSDEDEAHNAQGAKEDNAAKLSPENTSTAATVGSETDSQSTTYAYIGNSQLIPDLNKDDKIYSAKCEEKQHFTEPPPRFTEASLVKHLEELGIGRPSTYASIISVLQDRQYVHLDKKRFVPDSRGSILSTFLVNFFKKYVEYDFTANLENDLDSISEGKIEHKQFLRHFWDDFAKEIGIVKDYKNSDIIDSIQQVLANTLFPNPDDKVCSACKDEGREGVLSLKFGKFGAFIACSNYPDCKYTHQIIAESSMSSDETDKSSKEKILGNIDGRPLMLKKGRFGDYLELETAEGLKRTSLSPEEAKNITLELAEKKMQFPKFLGKVELKSKQEDVMINVGRFGPYIKVGGKNIKLPKTIDHNNATLDQVMHLIG